jgi:hypothetical protein
VTKIAPVPVSCGPNLRRCGRVLAAALAALLLAAPATRCPTRSGAIAMDWAGCYARVMRARRQRAAR